MNHWKYMHQATTINIFRFRKYEPNRATVGVIEMTRDGNLSAAVVCLYTFIGEIVQCSHGPESNGATELFLNLFRLSMWLCASHNRSNNRSNILVNRQLPQFDSIKLNNRNDAKDITTAVSHVWSAHFLFVFFCSFAPKTKTMCCIWALKSAKKISFTFRISTSEHNVYTIVSYGQTLMQIHTDTTTLLDLSVEWPVSERKSASGKHHYNCVYTMRSKCVYRYRNNSHTYDGIPPHRLDTITVPTRLVRLLSFLFAR